MSVSAPRLLVVDDDALVRSVIVRMLSRAGFTEIVEAPDGTIALALASSGSYDLVITDWDMPSLGGLGLLEALRASPRSTATPVLVVAGAFVAEALAAGADAALGKPFGSSELIATVRELLARGASKK